MPLIEVRNLHHRYPLSGGEHVHALRGVDLTVGDGEYIALAGANGSGKTTLALHLNGMLQPYSGTVTVAGLSTADSASLNSVRRVVAMVFQSPDDQLVATVVEEDVAFGPENLGVDPEALEDRVTESLERVGMLSERLRSPHQLSAGQKQRVAIAGALAMHPRCLVLDEVTSMLDPSGADHVIGIIEELNQDGMTVISVTHKMGEAARAGRLVVLAGGEVVTDGSPAEVFEHPDLGSWKLRPPFAKTLGNRLRVHLPRLPRNTLSPASLAAALAEGSRV